MDATRDGRAARPGARARHRAAAGLRDVRPQPVGGGGAVPRLRAAQRQGAVRRARATRSRAARRRCRWTRRDLLVELDHFVSSVDRESLEVTVRELGLMFNDTGVPLQKLLDSGGKFIDEAAAHEEETVALLQNGLTVLRTQRDEGENIRTFSRNLNLITRSLRRSDDDLRGTLQDTPAAVREVDRLLRTSSPPCRSCSATRSASTRSWSRTCAGLEQLLVTFPRDHRERLHRHAGQQRRPGEPPVLQQGAAVHQRLQAEQPVAPGRRAHRRPDLPGPVQQPGAVQHARHEVRPRRPAQPGLGRPRLPLDVRPAHRTGPRGQWTRRATPYDSSTRGTCRFWEGIRGSGCWWGRWRQR